MTPTQDPEQERKALQLAQAYQDVFGTDKDRDPSQRLVWEDLENTCAFRHTILRTDSDGAIDPLKIAANEGCRMVFLRILVKLERARLDAFPKTEVKVTRGKRKTHDNH